MGLRVIAGCFALTVLVADFSRGAKADEFLVFYLGGQSNMEGFGRVEQLPPELRESPSKVLIFHATAREDQRPIDGQGVWAALKPGHGIGFSHSNGVNHYGNHFGVELSLGTRLQELNPVKKIAIIKYARNGSSISQAAAQQWGCWEPDFLAPKGEYRDVNQYDQFLATLRNSLSIRDIDGDGVDDELIPAGIVWMQGESDAAVSQEIAKQYAENLKRLMDLMRAAFREDDLPVVIGRISDSKNNSAGQVWPFGEIVRGEQAEFCQQDSRATLVTSTDDYQYSDPWHYDSAGYIDLGERFAEALLELRSHGAENP